MKNSFLTLLIGSALVAVAFSQPSGPTGEPFAGRWDLTVKMSGQSYPSWMEVNDNGGNPEVRVVGRTGSVHPATDAKFESSHLTFKTTDPFPDKQAPISWDVTVAAGNLTGIQKGPNGAQAKITGFRAPQLREAAPPAWSDPEPLFNGQNLQGWHPDHPSKNHWTAQNGELVNQAAGANIFTDRKFTDFKLHIEYNCPPDGNSGVYLRGRYEVQVEYEAADKNDKFHMMGSIYGFIPPAETVSPRPGQWESYDIMLIGRYVTVVRDDVKTIDNQEIPGITGGALDSHEGSPGPLYIQGDHTGGMKYRNIKISVPKQ